MFKKYAAVLSLIFIAQAAAADTLEQRFPPPAGYARAAVAPDSFAAYLRNLPLKPAGSYVKYYDGTEKYAPGVYAAVVDMPISPKDLQQCADAVMRLRGEWLFKQKKFDEIKFNFVSDNKPRYFKDYANRDYSYAKFLKYMDWVFAYANTTSLYNELKPVENFKDMRAGDVFVQTSGGLLRYGHAETVVDVAVNAEGKKVYMLAQSYMPAQETQILQNPLYKKISPWYELKDGAVNTPEWVFYPKDLRRF
ncbi:MAG: DUF4846 domain-containing protein [Elusimicrobium sp.]|jgi:hypothetical protein|nr:DUF4846 domain-containing protein [Elusimicrobium sp.]